MSVESINVAGYDRHGRSVLEGRNILPFYEQLSPLELIDRFGHAVHIPVILDHTLRRATSAIVDKSAASAVLNITSDLMAKVGRDRIEAARLLREQIPLIAWVTRHKSSWEVMEAIITNSDALNSGAIRTDGFGDLDRKGNLLQDWLVYNDEGASIRDLRLGQEVAIFDTWDVARGVAERARGFENFYLNAIRKTIQERIARGSKAPIIMIDFASGSYRYASQALHVLLLEDPALKRVITGDLDAKDKILLKLIGVDQDRGAKRYSDALAKKLGVNNFIENLTHEVTKVEALFDGSHHPLLKPETCVDVMTSSGLIDYFNGATNQTTVSKASFVVEMRERLKIGGLYCNANIVQLSSNMGTNYTEQDVLKTLFRWYPMHEVTPHEFAKIHLQGVNQGGWHPDELDQITVLPSCGRLADRSFVMISGSRKYENKYFAFSNVSPTRRLNTAE